MVFQLKTVDVWDTLLRRDCHPECIKLATALHVLFAHYALIREAYRSHWDLYRIRIEIERCLGAKSRSLGKDDEYEIVDVLSQWLNSVLLEPYDSQLPKQLAEYELSVEIARSFPDSDIVEYLQRFPATRTIFLSDFYMGGAMLKCLLAAKGLGHLIPEGISSSDVGLNKRSGRLFHFVHEKYGVLPQHHIHIGDNAWSDVSAARQSGVTAVHYLPATAHANRLNCERLFSSREALFEHIRALCAKEAVQATQGMSDRQAAAHRLGAEAAPLFVGFALWIAEQALIENVDRLCFLTREGEFFYRVFAALFPHQTFFGLALPPAGVLAVSRLSTFASSMRDVSIEEMSRIWHLFKSQSVSGLFTTLGIHIEGFDEILDQVGLRASDVVEDPEKSEAFNQLFSTPNFIDAVQKSISCQQKLLYSYLTQTGLQSGDRIGIVDIGWRGTIQDNLALLLPQVHFHGMYLGLRRFINPQPDNVSKSAYGPNENISNESINSFEVFAALEMICASPHGSVMGYSWVGEQISPCRQISEEENAAYEQFTRYFQQGVLWAVPRWQSYIERYMVTASEVRSIALRVWDTLRRAPDKDFVDLFIQTPQHDVFGFGDFFRRNQVPPLTTIFLAPLVKSKRRQLIEFVRRVQWSAAIQHIQGIGRFHRWTLVFTFQIANYIKHVRMRFLLIRSKADT